MDQEWRRPPDLSSREGKSAGSSASIGGLEDVQDQFEEDGVKVFLFFRASKKRSSEGFFEHFRASLGWRRRE